MSGIILEVKQERRVEIARSFAYKLNVAQYGGPQYESRDFFCSEKAECNLSEAAEVSAALYHFCKAQVMESVREYVKEMKDALRRAS